MKKIAVTAAVFFSLPVVPVTAQGDRSLTNSELRPAPERRPLTLQFSQAGNEAALQESILLLRTSVSELAQSLAVANAEAETFKRQAQDLSLQLDSLGLAELNPDPTSLEQKLIAAMRELRLEQQKRMELEDTVVGLVEQLLQVVQKSQDISPAARMEIETKVRKANELLGALPGLEEGLPVEPDLTNAMVIEVKPELSLVIANVGSRHGVRIGTPFRILRGRELIGTALVVDVRERISGAIIQNLENEENPARASDKLRVLTR